jgi:hypothetical protein
MLKNANIELKKAIRLCNTWIWANNTVIQQVSGSFVIHEPKHAFHTDSKQGSQRSEEYDIENEDSSYKRKKTN